MKSENMTMKHTLLMGTIGDSVPGTAKKEDRKKQAKTNKSVNIQQRNWWYLYLKYTKNSDANAS